VEGEAESAGKMVTLNHPSPGKIQVNIYISTTFEEFHQKKHGGRTWHFPSLSILPILSSRVFNFNARRITDIIWIMIAQSSHKCMTTSFSKQSKKRKTYIRIFFASFNAVGSFPLKFLLVGARVLIVRVAAAATAARG
jgi:hypothetical protein